MWCAALCLLSAHAQTTHELHVSESTFNPPYLSIQLGDHVRIVWDREVTARHNFTQVEQATWEVDGTTPLSGGFCFGEGTPNEGRDFTITPTNDVWYVCRFDAERGMKGVIHVEGGTGMQETAGPHEVRFAPNPASGRTNVVVPDGWPITVRILDGTGTPLSQQHLFGKRTVDLSNLGPGLYMAEVWYMDGPLLGRKRLLVER